MVIYSAKSFNADWCKCDVPGSAYALSPKGWIDQELFKHWLMTHFVKHAVSARPLLLLLDGHTRIIDQTALNMQGKKISFYFVCHLTQLRNVSHWK